ncbi:MAG: nitroreductase family protein [Armatimonadota bacterium]|nr:nitroreductase family protein [Armatimonadota bacterium]
MDAYRRIVTKRDLRTYTNRPIPRDVLVKILEAGRRSGSARNRQPWEFVVATDPKTLARLARCGRFASHLAAAAVVVVIVVESARDLFDAGRCAQSLMLGAWCLGIASCPATLHHEAQAREVLGVPEGRVMATAVALGYPHPRGRGRIERLALGILAGRGRRPLDDLVHWERYGNRGFPAPGRQAPAGGG